MSLTVYVQPYARSTVSNIPVLSDIFRNVVGMLVES